MVFGLVACILTNTTSRSRSPQKECGGRYDSIGGRGPSGGDGIGGFGSRFGGGWFDLGFFGGLLHSPLGDFGRLCRSLHPFLQFSRCSLHPPFQVSPSQILLLLGGCGGGNVLILYRGSGQSKAIRNVKTKSKFLRFFRPVWNESESNLKQSEIWRHNMKFFKPIWNQSETILKPIWRTHQSEIFQIDNMK